MNWKQAFRYCVLPFLACVKAVGAQQLPLADLAESKAWLALGYYQKKSFGGYQSEVDDSTFFLAADGARSPESELEATIEAFGNDINQDDSSVFCRYPARLKWLRGAAPELDLPANPVCPELSAWKNRINADSVTLIFPSAYLDSPSSMFGHTLLRFDQRGQTSENEILAYTVNYAATKPPEDSELAFVYRGLVGGYPGDVTVLPYFMKLKEYKDMESRDIWEYRLNLTEDETDFLLDIIWEIIDKRVLYYFFTENCSYRIISFLNIVRPEHELVQDFGLSAIPLDTIRTLAAAGFINSVRYRPSVRTTFEHQLLQLSEEEQQWVLAWAKGDAEFDPSLVPATEHGKAALLDASFQYARMATSPKVDLRRLSYDLLKARKEVPGPSGLSAPPQPTHSDEHGHGSRLVAPSVGYAYRQNYLGLTLRAAYHDELDPPLGYPRGSALKFGELELRYYAEDEFSVERIDLVSIRSIKPRTPFFSPVSWHVKLGGERYDYRGKRPFATDIKGLLGPAWQLNSAHYFYFLVGADLRLAPAYEDDYNVYSLGEIGFTGRGRHGQWQIKTNMDVSVLDTKDRNISATARYVYNLGSNHTLAFEASRKYISGQYTSEFGLGVGIFF